MDYPHEYPKREYSSLSVKRLNIFLNDINTFSRVRFITVQISQRDHYLQKKNH